jgi:hypothetical protein
VVVLWRRESNCDSCKVHGGAGHSPGAIVHYRGCHLS